MRCKVVGSLSPSLAVRRMVSAIDCTCEELTGSGNDATAASIASFMMAMVSGENDAFEKSFTSSVLFREPKADFKRNGPARVLAEAAIPSEYHLGAFGIR